MASPLDVLDLTVSEAVRRCPEAMPALHRRGIDLCCGGWMTLREAARRAGIAAEELAAELAACGLAAEGERP